MSNHRASLRPLGMPRALHVRTGDGDEPLAISRTNAHGRPGRELRVERVEGIWRLAEAWWREAPQQRTYYHLLIESGRPLTLFRDDTVDTWFEQPYTAPDGLRTT